ncbi:hypothetical protein EDC22_101471 [Tepidamorphus gemmatus]|uniref:Uncharacterized protein n=1 Tax=Tepidamorphus gemmatus TaxID=747076 RepID=A0A4R3MIB1_9HYPH|nr:DUF6111 family protein [Tepidamorphus gemmatus]TCT13601.1 hypothetical protein EDC22_101471 [Tepidamorphus gemmatus]
MVRVLGMQLALFLLPFVVYGLYLYFSRVDPLDRASWKGGPVYWLAIAGLLIAIAAFVLTATYSGAPPGADYTPAQLRDGRIEPGRLE